MTEPEFSEILRRLAAGALLARASTLERDESAEPPEPLNHVQKGDADDKRKTEQKFQEKRDGH